MNTKLTPEILKAHGFVELDKKDVIGRSIYDLMPNKGTYAFNIQVVLNPQYPESNPNSGIVSIHLPDSVLSSVPVDLLDKEEWTEEDMKRSTEHYELYKGFTQPIAWHVTTLERLQSIVTSLTMSELLIV